jgi:hypothetical protein
MKELRLPASGQGGEPPRKQILQPQGNPGLMVAIADIPEQEDWEDLR